MPFIGLLTPTEKQVHVSRMHMRPIQVASGCVTGTGSPGHSSGCTQSANGGSGRIRLPTNSHIGQSGGEVAGLPMQENNSDCSGVAQHALVLGSSGHVHPNPTVPARVFAASKAFQSGFSLEQILSACHWKSHNT